MPSSRNLARVIERPRSGLARVRGVDMHWAELGEGPTVVLVHGFTRSHRVWLPVARLLAKKHRVLALDLPGAGDSGRPDAPYTLEWHSEQVEAWMEHLGLENVDAAGHSYGGGILQWLLLVNRARIRRLALVSSGGLGQDVAVWLRLASLPGLLEHMTDPALAIVESMLTRFPASPLARARTWLSDNRAPGTGRALARSVRNVIDMRGQRRSFFDHVHAVDELPPIRVFWGEDDRTIPADHGHGLAAALDHCELVTFRNCGHSPPRERPRELARALAHFFAQPSLPNARLKSRAGTRVA